MKIISGNSNLPLAQSIASYLGINLIDTNISKFADQEINVEIKESIRGENVFIVQSTSNPANDNLMELLITMDALKRGSAASITTVIPYFGYARQDRKSSPRSPISAKLVSNLITSAGAGRLLTVDLHAAQIQGFFDIPVDNLFGNILFVNDIKNSFDLNNLVIVSPDVGGVVRARSVAKWLGCDLAIIDKRRPQAGISMVVNVIGDINKKHCILVDDIADSCGTLSNAADALMEKGAASVSAYITHGVFSCNAVEKIEKSALTQLVCTDTIAYNQKKSPKIRHLSIAKLIADSIIRIHNNMSLSDLFLK
ncbi:Ribose-phosphate pyrophosphokinase [Candidatus Hepatincola sp. Pdp]